MNCLRCGTEIGENAVFCPGCLREMAKDPAIVNTHVLLPKHPDPPAKKQAKRVKIYVDAEEIKKLHARVKKLRILWAFTLVLLFALGVYSYILYHVEDEPAPGQNYSTVVETTVPPVTIS